MILLEARYWRWKQVNIKMTPGRCFEKSGRTKMNKEINLAGRGEKKKKKGA